MSPVLRFALAIVLPVVGLQEVGSSVRAPREPERRSASDLREVELLAYHDLRKSYGFTSESYGMVEIEGTIYNRDSQITFVNRPVDRLLVSTNGGENGNIIDLGDVRGSADSSAYWSLFWQQHRDALLPAKKGFGEAEVHVGHNYLAVVEEIGSAAFGVPKGGTLFVKLRVVEHVPGQTVRFVWEPLGP